MIVLITRKRFLSTINERDMRCLVVLFCLYYIYQAGLQFPVHVFKMANQATSTHEYQLVKAAKVFLEASAGSNENVDKVEESIKGLFPNFAVIISKT